MARPSAATTLLVVAAIARATGLVLVTDPADGFDPLAALVWLEVAVPAALALHDHRRTAGAAAGALAFGAYATARLMTIGLRALAGPVPLDGPLLAVIVATSSAALAGAAVVGRWQDHGAPVIGPGRRWPRLVAVVAAVVVAVAAVTVDVALVGLVELEVVRLPGPIGVATTVELRRLPLLLGVLAPVAWVVTRADGRHLRAVALVVGARAVVELAADAALLPLGASAWPVAVLGLAAVALLAVVPAGAVGQVTSSRA